MTQYFQLCKKSDIAQITRSRPGETKLGETIDVPHEPYLHTFLQNTPALFVILGIAEDIGVLANNGVGGTAFTWNSFLRSFVNIQDNEFTQAKTIAIIGHFSFDQLKESITAKSTNPEDKVSEFRKAVTTIDESVAEVIQLIVSFGKIPVVIGGGHNNCYPIIKGSAIALRESDVSRNINCVNLDAHTDYRQQEGRHSGNGFRFAKQEGYLNGYFALSIHENYIPNLILKEINVSKDIRYSTYEDIFVRQKKSWKQALDDVKEFLGKESFTGIELDLDSIEFTPSSAATPCGVSSREAMQYLHEVSSHCRVAYLHVCEGIATDNGLVGKLISYLVGQFVKSLSQK